MNQLSNQTLRATVNPQTSRMLRSASTRSVEQGSLNRLLQFAGLVFLTTTTALAASTSGVALATSTPPIPFSDSFESTSIYNYWTQMGEYGTVVLSKDVAYSGTHSLKFASSSGGNRVVALEHSLGALTKGTVSIAFYDVAPGQETLYEQLAVFNANDPTVFAAVGTMDFDSTCYAAYFGNSGTSGPNADCGQYPQTTTSPIKRTSGWHVLSISYGLQHVSISLDGTVVWTSAAGNYQFDTIRLMVSGPSWRPNTVAYFDDFKFTPLTY